LTKKQPAPNRYWLAFVKTNLARIKIKNWFVKQDQDKTIKEGKAFLNEQLEKLGKPLLDPVLSVLRLYDGKRLSLRGREEVLENIGNGNLPVTTVLKKVFSLSELLMGRPQRAINQPKEEEKLEDKILIRGEEGMPLRLASCCHPRLNESIVGYVTRGKGITVHRQNCNIVTKLESVRLIEAGWKNRLRGVQYPVKLQVNFLEREGIIRDITRVILELQMTIVDFAVRKNAARVVLLRTSLEKDSRTGKRQDKLKVKEEGKVMDLLLEIRHFDDLNRLIYRLENMEGVQVVRKIEG